MAPNIANLEQRVPRQLLRDGEIVVARQRLVTIGKQLAAKAAAGGADCRTALNPGWDGPGQSKVLCTGVVSEGQPCRESRAVEVNALGSVGRSRIIVPLIA